MKKVSLFFMVLLFVLAGCTTGGVSQNEYDAVVAERDNLQAELSKRDAEILLQKEATAFLEVELDELKNGASRSIAEIRLLYEQGEEDKVLAAADILHYKFTGTPEDAEAQKYVSNIYAQQEERKIIEAEEARIAAEEANKSAQAKARELINITKVSVGRPNSAGGVDLFIGYKNNSDKIIKYVTFEVHAYNAVGDPAKSQIGDRSVYRAQDEGPRKKGEGIAGNTNWYWQNAWYTWSIDKVILEVVEIEYMDGTTEVINGSDFDYQW